jgi:bifunctional DNase/RNase
MLIKVDIASFAVDPSQNIPVIILKENAGERTIPLSVGSIEASSIAIKYLDIKSERPLTIDLAKLIIKELGATLKRVVIYDLVDLVFFANIHLATEKSVHVIDCRPSDAIALALRCDCDIFVEDAVFEKNITGHVLSDKERLKKNITGIDTLEFGKYYLE